MQRRAKQTPTMCEQIRGLLCRARWQHFCFWNVRFKKRQKKTFFTCQSNIYFSCDQRNIDPLLEVVFFMTYVAANSYDEKRFREIELALLLSTWMRHAYCTSSPCSFAFDAKQKRPHCQLSCLIDHTLRSLLYKRPAHQQELRIRVARSECSCFWIVAAGWNLSSSR